MKTFHAAAITLVLFVSAPAVAQEMHHPPSGPTIEVSATGSAEAEPDEAVVNLAVETFAETARQAASDNAAAMQRVTDALREMGIPSDRIRTTGYQLYPEYDRQPREEPRDPEIVGYRARNNVLVTVTDVTRAGAVIDTGIRAGANRVAGLNFQLSDAGAARQEALRNAFFTARTEARTLAQAAGIELGEPLRISTDASPAPPRPYPAARMEAGMADASTPVEPGTIEVQANVHIVYRMHMP